jgi:MFS family permease
MSSFVGRFWTGRASDLYGRGIFVSGSLICYIAAMMMLAWADTPSLFLIAGGLEGIGSGIVIPMIITLVSDRSGVEERGKVFSVCISGLDVGTAIAGPFFGWLGEIVGYRGLFQLSSVLSLCALVLFATQGNPSVRSSWKFALGQEQDRYAN